MARIEQGRCRLISRKGNEFKSFSGLSSELAKDVAAETAIIDGEIVCLDENGKPQFRDLRFSRGDPLFIGFDLVYHNGQNLKYAPLTERKHRLRSILKQSERILFCDHIEADGERLFRYACEQDLEGVVAKRKFDPYLPGQTSWLKIRNPNYGQWAGRQDLFDRERSTDPDLSIWDGCALACAELDYAKL